MYCNRGGPQLWLPGVGGWLVGVGEGDGDGCPIMIIKDTQDAKCALVIMKDND